MLDGGITGPALYDYGMPTPRGRYTPNPHYAYLGAPVGRSGTESASIAGATYRNVWLGATPRPASLGSASPRSIEQRVQGGRWFKQGRGLVEVRALCLDPLAPFEPLNL